MIDRRIFHAGLAALAVLVLDKGSYWKLLCWQCEPWD